MFQGYKKAITFSYDDGVTQDQRLIEILDKYGLKCTFNLNSGLLGQVGASIRNNKTVPHVKPRIEEVAEIYRNHEVAVHTLTHPFLPDCEEAEIIRQVEEDRIALSNIVGYEVKGMAYPCGGQNNDDRVAEIIRNHTGVTYSRTITSSHSFDLQENLYRFHPTVYHLEKEKTVELAKQFLELETDTPKLFYIWGHSYEFDADNSWGWFEELCKMISGKKDIFYGTNGECFNKCFKK